MKRILALFLVLSMIFTFAACASDTTNDSTSTPSSGTPASSTPSSEGSDPEASQPASSTPPESTPDESTPSASQPATSAPAADGSHTHSYTSKETKAATCTEKGVKTFTCSCGDTYTENINAKGHAWGDWKVTKEPSTSEKGKAQRKCTTCSATEDKILDEIPLPFQEMFSGGNALAASCLVSSGMTTEAMLNFCSYEIFHSYIYEKSLTPLAEKHKITIKQQDFYFTQYAVPEDVVIDIIMNRFVLMEDFWFDMLRSSERYDSATKTFRCTEPVWYTGIDAKVLAYEHMGGDDYQLYLESRITNHPTSPCNDCATTDSCVLDRSLLSVTVCARPGYAPIIIFFGTTNSIPDSATPLN